ncbi:hypothetical protein, partial [Bradyrhizobium sp. CCBAU 51745]|uniref:hypothetical protein n=1 Tax=Bradyrhizobium sp. CCBAU 51745 TaxID=1325099 RepID=UPI0023055F71
TRSADSFVLVVSTTDAEIVASERERLFRIRVFKAKACTGVAAIGPPVNLFSLCDARSFSAEQVQLSSSSMYDQAMFVGH